MTKFSIDQISIMMSALEGEKRSLLEAASDMAGRPERAAEAIRSDFHEMARTAEGLREMFATEFHRRHQTGCELAHPGKPCPFGFNAVRPG